MAETTTATLTPPEPAQIAEPASTPAQPQSYAEFQKTWTPEETATWRKTGKEPRPWPETPPAAPVVEKEAAGSEAKTPEPKPESDPGVTKQDDDDLEDFGDQRTNQAVMRLRRQRNKFRDRSVAAETRLEAAEREIARLKTNPTAPTASAAPARETRQADEPYLDDPKYQREDGTVDVAAHAADTRAWKAVQSTDRFIAHHNSEAARTFADAMKLAQPKEGFDPDAFKKTPITWPVVNALNAMSPQDGAAVLAYLTAHPEDANALAGETDVLSSEESLGHALLRTKQDPDAALHFGAALGIARYQANEILKKLKTPAAPVTPEIKPRAVTKAPEPGARVTGASAGGDPEEDAYKKRDYKTAKALANQRQLQKEAERRHTAW